MSTSAIDRERAAWLRRRVRLMSLGFLVTFVLLYLLTEPAVFTRETAAWWLHLPQATLLGLHWLWLRRPRLRIEWATVLVWSASLAYSGLWIVMADDHAAPQYVLGILVTVLFAAPVARLSFRPTTTLLLISGAAMCIASLYRYGGSPPLLLLKDALLIVPGVALAFDAASRDQLERAEFGARMSLSFAHQSLQRAEEARTRLFVNLSHDFRTPLTLIRGEAERLEARPRPSDEEAALSCIGRNASALADLVDQLLELARLDAGASPRSPVHFGFAPLAAEVAAQLQPASAAVAIVTEDGAPPAIVFADRAHVRRILFNLASNGVRQLRGDGELHILARTERAQVIIDVIDDGPGIAEDRRAHIFARFASFEAGSTASGIGLPLARELAELSGGTLALLPDASRTTFRLCLPAGRAELIEDPAGPGPPRQERSQQLISEEGGTVVDSAQEAGRPRLLILEDHEEMAAFLRRAFVDRFEVEVVHGVDDALRSLAARVPRVVISDVLLGDRTGYDFLQALRAAPLWYGIPVVMVSALSDAAQRVRGLRAGADDYLGKPFSTEELRARVTAALDRADARQGALRGQRDALLMELHDGVNAALSRAALLLSSGRDGEEARRAVLEAVREALDESTSLLSVLEAPEQAFDATCAELRRQLAETCERHGLRLEFAARSDGSCRSIQPAAGHALRRIAHEALTNVIRHARARVVSCTVLGQGGHLTLRIEDDGHGIPPEQPAGRGMGIIQRRARQLGGRATFGSAGGHGARVEADLPG